MEIFVNGKNKGRFKNFSSLNTLLSQTEQQKIISKCNWESFVMYVEKVTKQKNKHKESSISAIGNLTIDLISNGDYLVAIDICL